MSTKRNSQAGVKELIAITFDHGSTTTDTTHTIFKAMDALEVVKVEYINVTGLAEDASDFFALSLKNGSTVIATHSTETGEEGSIAANTFTTLALEASPNPVLDAGDVLSLDLNETGTATLPAGRLVVHARYL
jgi:hypothetical protein